MTQETITGSLRTFSEQGVQDNAWAFFDDKNLGYHSLHILKNGDHLKIFADAAREVVRWEGIIDLDPTVKTVESTAVHEFGFPNIRRLSAAKGFQRGMEKQWADMFLRELPALLTPCP